MHQNNPAPLIKAHYEQMLDIEMSIDPARRAAGHPGLQIELVAAVRCEGDWLLALVTPWAISLLLLNGGGRLWGEIPAGQRRYIDLPGATLAFVAEQDAEIGSWQTAALVPALAAVADMAAARRLAQDGLQMALGGAQTESAAQVPTPKAAVSRRGFLRRLAGKRD